MTDNFDAWLTALEEIKTFLTESKNSSAPETPEAVLPAGWTTPEPEPEPEPEPDIDKTEFEELQKLLNSDSWPTAVNPSLICDITSEEDKLDRAEGITELVIAKSLEGLKFLDFGCGEGHISTKVRDNNKPTVSIGYDIKKAAESKLEWENEESLLTTDFDKVKSHGPYDIILMYDVLDHIEGETISSVLSKIQEVSKPDSTIYVRCHPWSSRHASHLYQKINKAFLHLVFSEKEMEEMGCPLTDMSANLHNVVYPIHTYQGWFKEAGLVVKKQDVSKTSVEKFFEENSIIRKRILQSWPPEAKFPSQKDFPSFQMSQSFVDYELGI